AFGGSAALCRWGAGLLADRIGTSTLLPLALVASGAGLIVVALGMLSGSGIFPYATILAAALVFGAGYGAIQNLTLLEAFAHTHQHDMASAAWNACFDSGMAVGAFAVRVIAAAGLGRPGAFISSAIVVLLTLPLVPALRRVSFGS